MMKYLFVILALVAISSVASASKVEGPLDCPLCKFIVQETETYIAKNSTETTLIADLDNACQRLPSDWRSECVSAVNQYATIVFNLLINNESPAQVCSKIGFCSSRNIKQIRASNEECSICKMVAQYVDAYVEAKANATEIETLLNQDCAYLKVETWVSQCQAIVDQYTPFIIQYIETNETPAVICGQVGLCSGSSSSNAEQIAATPIECEACEYVATFVESYAKQNKTMDEIIALITPLCKYAKEFSAQCDKMVQVYIPDIITMVDNDFTPQQICQKLTLCNAPNTPSPRAIHIRFNQH